MSDFHFHNEADYHTELDADRAYLSAQLYATLFPHTLHRRADVSISDWLWGLKLQAEHTGKVFFPDLTHVSIATVKQALFDKGLLQSEGGTI